MTCREKLKLEHPECLSSIEFGGCYNCPRDYGYMDRPDWCRINDATCTRCWDREIPGTEPKKINIMSNAKVAARELAELRDALTFEGFTREEVMHIIVAFVRSLGGVE